jgi:Phosphotransferase enzyme family
MDFQRLKKTFGDRLSIHNEIASTGKSRITAATLNGQPVVIKTLATGDKTYSERFQWELSLYQKFMTSPPPFRAPVIEYVSLDPALVVMERLQGTVLSEERFLGENQLALLTTRGIVRLLLSLRGYKPLGIEDRHITIARYMERWRRYSDIKILSERDSKILNYLASLPDWTAEFNHGDPIPPNIFMGPQVPTLLDWKFSGAYAPLYDIAIFWVVCARYASLQSEIERTVQELPHAEQVSFATNALSVASREIKIHRELPDLHPTKTERLALLDSVLEKARLLYIL